MGDLDSHERIDSLRRLLERKTALRKLYAETYCKYAACLSRCGGDGLVVELGSGASFIKDFIPEALTTDIVAYAGLDRVVDATAMPFDDCAVRAFFLLNTFHHIADSEAFLKEAARCLAPGGRLLIVDQHPGWLSAPIYRFAHHEPFHPRTTMWSFASDGPLSGANGALAWIVFRRDRERLAQVVPELRLERYTPHTPLRYWLAGGLKSWSLLPGWAFGAATAIDRALVGVSEQLASFVDIELVRVAVTVR